MKFRFVLAIILLVTGLHAQDQTAPKLIVGVVVDQMRAEYLYRFQENYSERGFKRLMNEGFHVKNMHYNYVPTYTAPGHSSIFTGTTPANHGIVANEWYNREKERKIYCAEDESVFLVDDSKEQRKEVTSFSRSPKNLRAATITDELKLYNNGRSKVLGISLKDRGAIMPAGHLADYAFWYSTNTGDFITSSYYNNTLPKWLMAFNKRKLADSLLNQNWKPLLPNENYRNSSADNALYEKILIGKESSEFPFDLKQLRKENGDLGLLAEVPFGNTLLTQMAKATITGENLGRHDDMDFLTISYSSTDYIGHYYGIRSKELQDTYVRLDREIEELLDFLDSHVGQGKYLLFLTADHAGSDNPNFLKDTRLSGNFLDTNAIKTELNQGLSRQFGNDEYVNHIDQLQIYFKFGQHDRLELLRAAKNILNSFTGIKETYVPEIDAIRNMDIDKFFRSSYNKANSGDILMQFEPGWIPIRNHGTTHGTSYNDDTHVPALFYGWNIKPGSSAQYHAITQIVPTLCMGLNLPLPNMSDPNPILEVFKN